MGKIRQICACSFRLYKQRFFRSRTLIVWILLFIGTEQYYIPLKQACTALGHPCSVWYIINIMTNDFVCSAVGLSAVYLFSNAPYLNRRAMYQHIRMGKTRWAAAQLGSIVLSGVTMTVFLFLMGVIQLLPNAEWTLTWGKMMKTLAVTNASEQFGIPFFLQYSFMNSMEAWEAGILAFLLDSAVFIVLGFFLFSIGLLCGRLPALVFTGILAVLPFAMQAWDVSKHRWLHTISPVSWLQTGLFHTKRIVYEVMPPVSTVFAACGVCILLAVVITGIALHRNSFEWNGEEE